MNLRQIGPCAAQPLAPAVAVGLHNLVAKAVSGNPWAAALAAYLEHLLERQQADEDLVQQLAVTLARRRRQLREAVAQCEASCKDLDAARRQLEDQERITPALRCPQCGASVRCLSEPLPRRLPAGSEVCAELGAGWRIEHVPATEEVSRE